MKIGNLEASCTNKNWIGNKAAKKRCFLFHFMVVNVGNRTSSWRVINNLITFFFKNCLEIKQKKLAKLHSKLDQTRKVRRGIIKAKMAGKFIPND